LPNGSPSHDTFERVFKWIDGKEFERSFILWMPEICKDKELGIVAIVGKTMRGSGDKDKMTGPQKRFRACWDETYMASVLLIM
jgi:hypothetical protein